LTAELIGFFTLTLPVILYFTFTEAGRHQGSFGKQKLNLVVVSRNAAPAGFSRLLLRNFIKFLPWEIAHFFVYHLVYFGRAATDPPGWVMVGLITSQTIAIIYLLFIFFNKDNRSIYEIASGTRVLAK
jgi:uncharacterized RDD family membrane protein YckC